MLLQAKNRLQADDKATKEARRKLQEDIDKHNDKIDTLKKGLPSRYNKMKVAPAQQVKIRKQILDEKDKVQNIKLKKIQLKGK